MRVINQHLEAMVDRLDTLSTTMEDQYDQLYGELLKNYQEEKILSKMLKKSLIEKMVIDDVRKRKKDKLEEGKLISP